MNKTIRNLLIVVALLLVANFLVAALKPQIVTFSRLHMLRVWPSGRVDTYDHGLGRWFSPGQRKLAVAERELAAAGQEILQEKADREEAERRKVAEVARYKKLLLYRDEFIEKKEQGAEPNIVEQKVFEGVLSQIMTYEIYMDLVAGRSTGETLARYKSFKSKSGVTEQ